MRSSTREKAESSGKKAESSTKKKGKTNTDENSRGITIDRNIGAEISEEDLRPSGGDVSSRKPTEVKDVEGEVWRDMEEPILLDENERKERVLYKKERYLDLCAHAMSGDLTSQEIREFVDELRSDRDVGQEFRLRLLDKLRDPSPRERDGERIGFGEAAFRDPSPRERDSYRRSEDTTGLSRRLAGLKISFDIFSGKSTDNFVEWRESVEDGHNYKQLDSEERMIHIKGLLRGRARNYLRKLENKKGRNLTLREFDLEFDRYFNSSTVKTQLWERAQTLAQGMKSVAEYRDQLEDLIIRSGRVVSEEDLVIMMKRGLKPRLREKLQGAFLEDPDRFVLQATLLEEDIRRDEQLLKRRDKVQGIRGNGQFERQPWKPRENRERSEKKSDQSSPEFRQAEENAPRPGEECFYCKKFGHKWRECPERLRNPDINDKQSSSNYKTFAVLEEGKTVELEFDDQIIQVILDTGASISLLGEEFASQVAGEFRVPIVETQGKNIVLADGRTLKLGRKITLDIEIASRRRAFSFWIAPSRFWEFDILLGLDFFEEMSLDLTFYGSKGKNASFEVYGQGEKIDRIKIQGDKVSPKGNLKMLQEQDNQGYDLQDEIQEEVVNKEQDTQETGRKVMLALRQNKDMKISGKSSPKKQGTPEQKGEMIQKVHFREPEKRSAGPEKEVNVKVKDELPQADTGILLEPEKEESEVFEYAESDSEDRIKEFERLKIEEEMEEEPPFGSVLQPYEVRINGKTDAVWEILQKTHLAGRNDLTVQEKEALQSLLWKNRDLFATDVQDLGTAKSFECSLDLEKEEDVKAPTRRLAKCDEDFLKKTIDKLLENGLIRRSNSKYTSPVLIVHAIGKELRFCIDYRRLNQLLRKKLSATDY